MAKAKQKTITASATKRGAMPMDANSPNGVSLRTLGWFGFLQERRLTIAEISRWREVLGWPVEGLTPTLDKIPASQPLSQFEALICLQHSCHYGGYPVVFLDVDGPKFVDRLADTRQDWAAVKYWLCTSKSPVYDPAPGKAGRELDPDFTGGGESPLMAFLDLISMRIKSGEWRSDPRAIPALRIGPVYTK